uniref:Ubiquitinyl hydrolase 1 n=1 Tax=Panagrellus redivivus TaxID=6233 RepID=A0A7E4WD82_PANRE
MPAASIANHPSIPAGSIVNHPSMPAASIVNHPSIPAASIVTHRSLRSAVSDKPEADKVIGVDTDWKLKYRSPTTHELKKYCADFEVSPANSVIKRQSVADLRQYVPHEVEPILGDGHCGYRTVSFLLTGTQNHYMQVRQKLCSWVADGKLGDVFTKSLCPELGPMKAKAKASSGFVGMNMWMGIDDLYGLATKLEINVVQYHTGTKTWMPFNDYFFLSKYAPLKDAPSLLIQYTGNHYEAIKSIKKKNC